MTDKQFIKNMDEYFDIISEAFENPLPIRWVDKVSELIGLFTVNNNVYQINCVNKGSNVWKYDFYFLESDKSFTPELTGFDKDKFRVLPTIKAGFEYLDLNKKPDAIVFGAADKSRGRKKIYESFCHNFASDNDYTFYTKMQLEKQIFVLYKKDIDKNTLTTSILRIIEDEK